jgi:hypothetical protein
MASTVTIETSGTIDEKGQLHLDEPVNSISPGRVRVILMPEFDDIDEAEWLHAAASNESFSFLREDSEDIYGITDGKPFNG